MSSRRSPTPPATSVARRFGYAYVDSFGTVTPAGPAPYLDCVAAPDSPAVDAARDLPWLADAEDKATSWIIANQLPEYLAEVQPRRLPSSSKARELVTKRLEGERDRLLLDAAVAAEKEQAGEKPKESSDSLNRKAVELDVRLRKRLALLDQQAADVDQAAAHRDRRAGAAVGMLEGDLPADAPIHAKETKEVERRGVDLVLARERELGRKPVEQAFNNPGFDILSTDANGDTYRIEVKARIDGAEDFFVTHNEVMTGKNAVPRYRLALVKVDPRGAAARRGPLPRRPLRHHRPRRLRRHRHPRRLGQDLGEGHGAVLMGAPDATLLGDPGEPSAHRRQRAHSTRRAGGRGCSASTQVAGRRTCFALPSHATWRASRTAGSGAGGLAGSARALGPRSSMARTVSLLAYGASAPTGLARAALPGSGRLAACTHRGNGLSVWHVGDGRAIPHAGSAGRIARIRS